jgi:hypothetical protein
MVNAPRLCKLRKECLIGIGHGAMVLTKCLLYFLIFQLSKAEQGPLRTVSEGLSFRSLDRRIYDCKLRNEKKI